MEITNAKYQLNFNGEVFAVNCTLNGRPSTVVPMDEGNSDWIVIKAKIDDKSLTVADADPLVTEEE
jgi:glycine cleavage system H lipoate-binding protein